ncbi:MAG: hypothetical protein H0U35_09395 [Sporichthyaceae bacterium]|nr:hypothetical protein [Sporichthyaceae bacterium]
MAPDRDYDALVADLAALGRELPSQRESATRVSVAVMARISDSEPVTASRPRLLGRTAQVVARRRRVVVVVTAVVLAALGTPPVRAAVADWFSFAGVGVRLGSTPSPSVGSPPPTVAAGLSLEAARRLVAFEPLVPTTLGAPEGVAVSSDRRLLSMSWTDTRYGLVRLDEFEGRLDYVFAKTAPDVEFTSVNGSFALWFDRPHEVVVLDADGTRRTETARLAGHTLIWEHGESTLRIEGDLTLAQARQVAGSAATIP